MRVNKVFFQSTKERMFDCEFSIDILGEIRKNSSFNGLPNFTNYLSY